MRGLLTAFVALLALTAASSAQATFDPLGSGQTRIVLDEGLLSLLEQNNVKLLAKAPAKRQGKTITLPIAGGKADPTTGRAEAIQAGTLVLQAGNRKLPLRDIELKAKQTPLFAKVGGGQLKIASAKKISSKRQGFGIGFSAAGLQLTQKVATRLNKKLRVKDLFKEGQALGTLRAKTVPQRVTILPQGQGTLIPAPTFLAKLKSLFVSLNPVSPAELSPGPVLHFPIAAGSQIAPNASEGTLRLGGAIELLQLGAGQVFHDEYWLDLGAKAASAEVDVEPTPAFPGKLGRIGVFAVGAPEAISSAPKSRTISVANALLTLDAQTAQTFNEAFAAGSPVFAAGEAFGAVSFAATGQ
jgi:hypothetical protein